MSRQSDLFDARLICANLFLGLSLWAELRGDLSASGRHASTANVAFLAVKS